MDTAIAGITAISAIREILIRYPGGPNTEPFSAILMGTDPVFVGYRESPEPNAPPWSRDTVMAHVLGEALWFMSREVRTTDHALRFRLMSSRMCLAMKLVDDPISA